MNSAQKIERIKVLLTRSQLFEPDTHDNAIQKLLLEVFDGLSSANHEETDRIRNGLLDCSEQYHNLFFMHLFMLHEQQLRQLSSLPVVKIPQDSEDPNEELPTDLLFGILRFVLENNESIGLSSLKMPSIEISKEMLPRLLSLLIDLVQYDIASLQWEREDIHHTIILLAIVRRISMQFERLHLFYELASIVAERMNVAEEFQLCRDFGEEVLVTSLFDDQVEWGYLALFKAFNGQSNINVSFIYANACLASLRKRSVVPNLILKLFFFSLQRLYRNAGFKEEEATLYKSMLKDFSLDDFDHFDITNTHLMTLASEKNVSVISALYEYLVTNREFVFERKSVALPLLNTAYHIRQIFCDYPGIDQLDPYLVVLESIVGNRDVDRLRAVVRGDSTHVKEIYIDQLSALNETRSAEDFVSEVRWPLVTADHLIKFACDYQDSDAFLLAMILKSDRTWILREKSAQQYSQFTAAPRRIDEVDSVRLRDYSQYIRNGLDLREGQACLWLTARGSEVFCLALTSLGFSEIMTLRNWQISAMNEWLDRGFNDLEFDDTISIGNQVESYLEEDQLEDLRKIKDALGFAKLATPMEHNLLVIKDMAISAMPHNLIMNLDGDFISRDSTIGCLPSAEWLIADRETQSSLPEDYRIELWIPTEGGDFTLNLMWSKLSEAIKTFDIKVSTEELPKTPLAGDINILSAHGAVDISAFHSLFTRSREASITNLEGIVGSGSVIILFACHSGSVEKDIFRQKSLSLVKMIIGNGYRAVVAPFWTLHINIPPIWLPEFLDAMGTGATIAEAVLLANRKVFETNKNPGAWACMHLYGNPDLRVETELTRTRDPLARPHQSA